MKIEDISEHRMHAEQPNCRKDPRTPSIAARSSGGRCIPIGTTALRTLESAAQREGPLGGL